jgi:hypothetical protein
MWVCDLFAYELVKLDDELLVQIVANVWICVRNDKLKVYMQILHLRLKSEKRRWLLDSNLDFKK